MTGSSWAAADWWASAADGRVDPDDARGDEGFGSLRHLVATTAAFTCQETCQRLNHILADSIVLYDLHRECRRLSRGLSSRELRHSLDQHALEQLELIDLLVAEVERLGGEPITDARRVAKLTCVRRPPDGATQLGATLSWLCQTGAVIIGELRDAIDSGATYHDDATSNQLLRHALCRYELQARTIASLLRVRPRRVDLKTSAHGVDRDRPPLSSRTLVRSIRKGRYQACDHRS